MVAWSSNLTPGLVVTMSAMHLETVATASNHASDLGISPLPNLLSLITSVIEYTSTVQEVVT